MASSLLKPIVSQIKRGYHKGRVRKIRKIWF